MLTPPPSPRPFYASPPFDPLVEKNKAALGRRYSLVVFLFPLCLALVALLSRFSQMVTPWSSQTWLNYSSKATPNVVYNSNIAAVIKRQTSSTPAPFSNPFPQQSRTSTASATTPSSSSSGGQSGLPTVPTASSNAAGIVPTPFPQPFDVSLGFNFSSSQCQDFFLSFTQDINFRKCRPMSLLLGSSQQFNEAQTNNTLLNDIVWGTCNTVPTESDCQTTMNNLTTSLQTECRAELAQDNVLVMQAMTGFQMYTPMRDATCQIDQNTNSYCLVEAVAASSPSDLYFYLLPYGNTLPNGTIPSCSTCIKNVLSIYAQAVSGPVGSQQASSTSSIPLDQTYPAAAQIAVQQCGSVYAQQVNISSAVMASPHNRLPLYIALLLYLVSSLL